MKKTILAMVIAGMFATTHAQNLETAQINSVLKQGRVDLAWAQAITGKNTVIGIVDQGFDIGHSDLRGKIAAARNFYSGSTVTWGLHGTQMASIAAGARNNTGTVGVAPDAKLVLAQVGPGGVNTAINSAALASGLRWISTAGASVVNLSFGADYETAFRQSVVYNYRTGVWFGAARYGANYGASNTDINNYRQITDRNAVLVVSAGNQALPYSSFPAQYAARTDTTGRLTLNGRMLVVGSVNSQNQISKFSNQAGHLCQYSQGTNCSDPYLTRDFFVVAPGELVYAATPNQLGQGINTAAATSGTSSSAAYVSGGIALMRQAWPQLRAEQIVNRLLATTRDLGAVGTDNVYGRGLVDFAAATSPQGTLRIASAQRSLQGGQPGIGVTLASTSAQLNAGLTSILRSNTVLTNSQVVDDLGRNYQANLSQAITGHLVNYNPDSPWLGITGFRQAGMPLGSADLKIMHSDLGTAAELQHGMLAVQAGSITEPMGFLGNRGTGALSMGSSSTHWMQFSLNHTISPKTQLIAAYGQGITNIASSPISMFNFDPKIRTASYRLGFQTVNWLEPKDKLSITAGIPVTIRSGHMQVTGVTGYDYQENNDGSVVAVPITSTQTMNLRSPTTEYNLVINYQQPLTTNTWIVYNLINRHNAGAQLGAKAAFLGINFTMVH